MKKLLLTACALTCAGSVFGQGTVAFLNRLTGSTVTHVYLGGTSQLNGNGSTDTPAGARDWSGFIALTGSGYTAALLSAPAGGNPETGLPWAAGTTTFRTGTTAGGTALVTSTLANVPKDAASAVLEMFVWDNKGGTYATPTAGWNAWQAGLTAGGVSGFLNLSAIGGDFNNPPNLYNSTDLHSFNIYTVPEPTTMALAGLGAAAVLIFRRRK